MLNRLWRFLFRLLYNEFAFAYDLVSYSVSLGQWSAWRRTALRHLPPADDGLVLELAHGTGHLQVDLIRAGYQTVALDLSAQMGRLARRKLRRARLPADLVRGDALKLPCKSNSVSAIVCTFPTPFIYSEPALAEMARVLRPSGCVIIVLVGQLRSGRLLPALISRLYRLSGQSDSFLSQRAIVDLIAPDAFQVESVIVTLPGSAVQLLMLTRVASDEKSSPDVSLESVNAI